MRGVGTPHLNFYEIFCEKRGFWYEFVQMHGYPQKDSNSGNISLGSIELEFEST